MLGLHAIFRAQWNFAIILGNQLSLAKGRFPLQSLCPGEAPDFNLVKNQSRGTPRK